MTELTRTMVEFKANGAMAPGYLVRPEGDGPFPGVVVIQEWWGLNDQIKRVTDRLAEQGFVALSPDLYRGQVAEEPNDAQKLAMEMDRDQALKDIQGAVNYLLAQPFVIPRQAGVMGFCMGGGLASMMSFQGQNVGAVVVFYGGRGEWTDEAVEAMSAPLLGLYGEADQSIPLSMIENNRAKLQAHGKPHEIVIYPGAPHAFFNDERLSYRPEAAEDAWKRTVGWFHQYLRA